MSNILIVESENDKYFIEALINYLNLNIETSTPICTIDDYECIGGMGKLENKLIEIKSRISKAKKEEEINKIGIIFDADNTGIEQRKQDIQEKIDFVFKDENDTAFYIYIMNVNGYGEFETVLKRIKSKDSIVADCLDSWQKCLPEDKRLKQKDFDKFWVQVYQRYDCCTKKEAKQAGKNCNNEVSLKEKDIWNFDHEILNELKEFLKELGEN